MLTNSIWTATLWVMILNFIFVLPTIPLFKNEIKKLIFIVLVAGMAFLLNLFPMFYPVGIFLVATLLAVQFVDYSWSRHEMHFGECLKDVMGNIIPYSMGGFIFLMMVAIPVVNAFVPAMATSYFTVLWLHRKNKISLWVFIN